MRTWLLGVALLVCGGALAADGMPQPQMKGVGTVWFGDYKPIEPRSLQDIPEPARSRIVAHIRDRVGNFWPRLRFAGGQVINIAELHRVEPNAKQYRWEVPAYILNFRFEDAAAGITEYAAEVWAREDGSIVREIELPAFRADPGKMAFVPYERAVAAARTEGFDPAKMDAELVYDAETDAVAWRLSEKTADDGLVIDYKYLVVSAHTGKVIRHSTGNAIR